MTRTTVDYGIDLGTTNSSIAILAGTSTEVIKNRDQNDITPSAVYFDKNGRLYVGRRARERVESDPSNTATEFKLSMGTAGRGVQFTNAKRSLEPDELSAEVLKSLKADVKLSRGEDLQAAVITVPAAFELNQCEATKRAAALAGLDFAPLIQEPTAAAHAYGFQTASDNVFWLVYDLGGGTFDAAIVHVRDGEFSVINHMGDNNLGGKLIDWAIVEQLLIPAVAEQSRVSDFRRGVPRWHVAIAKLKMAAEEAKIALSHDESATIFLDDPPLCTDDDGYPVEFEFELHRRDVERLAEPFVSRSLTICRKTLKEKRLGAGDIDRVILVGGPTLSPYIRDRIADDRDGLGIQVDFSRDPLTVVAQGAAIFAGTQRLESVNPSPPKAGEFTVDLKYKPVADEVEPFVGGVVRGAGKADLSSFAIEFVNDDSQPAWRSGRIELSSDGSFVANLWAERGRRNLFSIVLTDANCARVLVAPDSLVYTPGLTETRPRLTHSIGLGEADNVLLRVLERGAVLPASHRVVMSTTVGVRQGHSGGMIRIPVLEGEHARADRNPRIGTLEVASTQLRRDVPAGSEVEVWVKIDESRLVVTEAYVPVLDENFKDVMQLVSESVPDPACLQQEVQAEMRRMEKAAAAVAAATDPKARQLLDAIDADGVVREVGLEMSAALVDSDAARSCAKRLMALRAALDEVEMALEWPDSVRDADRMVDFIKDIVEKKGSPDDERSFERSSKSVQVAIENGDPNVLRLRVNELQRVGGLILRRTGELDVSEFGAYRDRRSEMQDPKRSERLLDEGDAAINRGDIESLRNVNRQLRGLFPDPPAPADPFSTVKRRWQ